MLKLMHLRFPQVNNSKIKIFTISIIVLLVFSTIYFQTSLVIPRENNPTFQINHPKQPTNTPNLPVNSPTVNLPQNDVSSKSNGNTTSIAKIDTVKKTSVKGFRFQVNNSKAGTAINQPSPYSMSVPVQNGRYDAFNATVSAKSQETQAIIESGSTKAGSGQASNYIVQAQGFQLPVLNNISSSVKSVNFNSMNIYVFNPFSNPGLLTVELWSAINRSLDQRLTPSFKISEVNVTSPGTNPKLSLNFPSNTIISKSTTYSNITAGYFFFLFYIKVPDPTKQLFLDYNTTGVDSGLNYNFTSASKIDTANILPNNWTYRPNFDIRSDFNYTVNFNPSNLNVTVENNAVITPLSPSNTYNQYKSYTTTQTYIFSHNATLAYGYPVQFNITYYQTKVTNSLASVYYEFSPKIASVNWSVTYLDTLPTSNATLKKFMYIPHNFTLTTLRRSGLTLTTPSDYTRKVFSSANDTLQFYTTSGTLEINATTPNLLFYSTVKTYVLNSTWIPKKIGTAGTLYPSVKQGSLVRGEVVNLASYKLENGVLNASLRSQTGQIYTNQSYLTYKDGYLSSANLGLVTNGSFITNLDPNITTGYYSFQYIFNNGTAIGGVFEEFLVKANVSLELNSPIGSYNALEGDKVNVTVLVLDRTHNSSWSSSSNLLDWQISTGAMTLLGKVPNDARYMYSYIIDLSVLAYPANPVKNTTYSVAITFNDFQIIKSVSFTLNVYYRGLAKIVDQQGKATTQSVLQANNTYKLYFSLLNVTGGSVPVNSSKILVSNNISSSFVYDYRLAQFNFTIPWSSVFRLGWNAIQFNWVYPGFRTSASLANTTVLYEFQVTDNKSPTIVPHSNVTMDEGQSSVLSWTVYDTYPATYSIYLNNSITVTNQPWSGTSISYNLNSMVYGVYYYSLQVLDSAGNKAVSNVTVTVRDVTKPVITFTSLSGYAEGTTGNQFKFISTDLHASYYDVFINNTLTYTNTWTSGAEVSINVDGLPKGVYIFKLRTYDLAGNYAEISQPITVSDVTPPNITPQTNVIKEAGINGTIISWVLTDVHPYQYQILLNNSVYRSGSWVSGQNVSVLLDSFNVGIYNFTIVAYDTSNLMSRDVVIITVKDTTPPKLLSSPPTSLRIFKNPEKTNLLMWRVQEINPKDYSIILDGKTVQSGSFANNQTISFNVTNLSLGVHNITVKFQDNYGNSVSQSVTLTIKNPVIIETKINMISQVTPKVFRGDLELITLRWTNLTGEFVPKGELYMNLTALNVTGYTKGQVIKSFAPAQTNSSGYFNLLLNYTGLAKGTYEWKFRTNRFSYETLNFGKIVVVENPQVLLSLEASNTLRQGENYTVSALVTYAPRKQTSSMLNLQSLIGYDNGPVAGVNITFKIVYTGVTNTQSEILTTVKTNKQGYAIYTIPGSVTSTFKSITSIQASVVDQNLTSPGIINSSVLPKILSPNKTWLDYVQEARKLIEKNLLVFVGILAFLALFLFLLLIRRRKTKIQKKMIEAENLNIVEEIDALRSISTILIKSNSTGIPFYDQIWSESSTVDPALLSGLTTAISSVLSELKDEELGVEVMQRSGLSIISHKNKRSTFIIVAEKPLPESYLKKITIAHQRIEDKFKGFINDAIKIHDIDPEVVKQMLIDSNLNLQLKDFLKIDVSQIPKVQNNNSISRNIRMNFDLFIPLANSLKEAELPLTLEVLVEYLRSKDLILETIYKTIKEGWNYNVIDTITNGSTTESLFDDLPEFNFNEELSEE